MLLNIDALFILKVAYHKKKSMQLTSIFSFVFKGLRIDFDNNVTCLFFFFSNLHVKMTVSVALNLIKFKKKL